MAQASALVGVDWGTSSFRAFLLASDGTILQRREAPRGILGVERGGFAAVLWQEIGGWLSSERLPVVMSGMIGSRQGWVEAPYMETPTGLDDIAGALVPAPFDAADVRIVPGIQRVADAMADVMRGEEAQVFGALSSRGRDAGIYVLPGTHSKWVRAEAGKIAAFATYMTGEVYAALRGHTILGRLMQDSGGDPVAFARGVADGARAGSPGALLHRLFGVRTAGLFDEIGAGGLPDYLSGLLIGGEVADQLGAVGAEPIRIIASEALAERYSAAAAALGIAAETVEPDCVTAAHLAIARRAGMLRPD